MIIAIASGKGGTGKTTVATSLASTLAKSGSKVAFQDCDVEAPNAHIFLDPDLTVQEQVNILIPEVDMDVCNACGKCAEVCEFHAIVTLGKRTLVFPELCHGCGSCTLVCPEKAITEIPRPVGILESGTTKDGIHFSQGVLNVGEAMTVPIISELLHNNRHKSDQEIIVRDAPPGASCPVVESLRGADFVILVTEPTPFGLHDLKLAVEVTNVLGLPRGVIVNRDGIGNSDVDDFCQQVGIPILMRIPFEREIGVGIAQGKNLIEICPEFEEHFMILLDQIKTSFSHSEVRP